MSSHWSGRDEEEEDEEDESEYKSFDDHLMFLIDVRKDMLGKNSLGEVILLNVLKLLLYVLKSKIVESDKSCVGAVCFGAVRALFTFAADIIVIILLYCTLL